LPTIILQLDAFRCLLFVRFACRLRAALDFIFTNFGCDPIVSYDSDTFHKNHSNMHSQADGDINVADELDVIDNATLLQILASKLHD
jgi:hypothetical protein